MTDLGWRAVLFDLDGTLADTVELILSSFRHTMEVHLGATPPDEEFLLGIGTPLPVQIDAFARSDTEHRAMLATYVSYQRSLHDGMVRAFPGAVSVLARLKARGVPLGLVTSKSRGIACRTLDVCMLTNSFDTLVCGDEVEHGKPHPEPVLRALTDLRVDEAAHRVLFVGDSSHDLRAGKAAGVRTAAVGWGPIARDVLAVEGPDYFLERMEEVLEITPDD
ncbi:MAG: HAD-IA family hydrolase [Gemmatimonadota bacterium]|nr:HAD-IA family hydrolase [Gemmatimonadota bacterium]